MKAKMRDLIHGCWYQPGPLALGLTLILVNAPGGAAAAAQSPPTRQIEVEITEGHQGKTGSSSRFLLALAGRTSSQVTARAGALAYRLQCRLEPAMRDGGQLECTVERSEQGRRAGPSRRGEVDRRGEQDVRLQVSARVRPRERVILGQVSRPDGSAVEVAATLR